MESNSARSFCTLRAALPRIAPAGQAGPGLGPDGPREQEATAATEPTLRAKTCWNMRPPETETDSGTGNRPNCWGITERLEQCGRSACGKVFVDRVDVGRERAAQHQRCGPHVGGADADDRQGRSEQPGPVADGAVLGCDGAPEPAPSTELCWEDPPEERPAQSWSSCPRCGRRADATSSTSATVRAQLAFSTTSLIPE